MANAVHDPAQNIKTKHGIPIKRIPILSPTIARIVLYIALNKQLSIYYI
jgi:hypothetical protein